MRPLDVSPVPSLPLTRLLQVTFINFVRSFGQVFGISIGTTVLGNQLSKNLPAAYAGSLGKAEGAIAAIPYIKDM